jgi:hypothetical protein
VGPPLPPSPPKPPSPLLPLWHWPNEVQVSPFDEQFWHALPAPPHAPFSTPGWQALAKSQHPEHCPGPHPPSVTAWHWNAPLQDSLCAAQLEHAPPLEPHAKPVFPGWHVPVGSQQPAQLAAPHAAGALQ